MPLRYTDLDNKKSAYSDFSIRRRFPTLVEIFMICLAVIMFGVTISLSVNDKIAQCSILFLFGGGMSVYMTRQLNRSRDLLQATEFQNALFASALNLENAFSFIVNSAGTIVYVSPGFNERFVAFVETDGHDIKTWIEAVRPPAEESAAILKAIMDRTKKELMCHLVSDPEHRAPCRMLIDPIPRPKGFILIRCRDDASFDTHS